MQKSKILFSLTGIAAALLLSGCAANVTIIPGKANQYTAVATAAEENDANEASIKKATKVCADQGKRLQVTSRTTKYQGLEKSQKELISAATSVARAFSKKYVADTSTSEDDYRVEMNFECVTAK